MSRTPGITGNGIPPSRQLGGTGDVRDQFRTARARVGDAPIEVRQVQGKTAGQEQDGGSPIDSIGQRLSDLRKAAGITQIKVANLIGSTQPSVARFESDANQPNLKTVERYAQSIQARVIAELTDSDGAVADVPLAEVIQRLADLRKEAAVSQTTVATRMDATQPAVARIERGEPAPNLKTIERYANAIGFGLGLRVERTG